MVQLSNNISTFSTNKRANTKNALRQKKEEDRHPEKKGNESEQYKKKETRKQLNIKKPGKESEKWKIKELEGLGKVE